MPITTWLRPKFMLESWSMKINNDIIIKLTLVYWLLLIVAQVFFRPFTTSRFVDNPSGGAFRVTSIEWDLIFNFAIFIPTVVIAIIRILQWKNKS